jgi:hypothetical protein
MTENILLLRSSTFYCSITTTPKYARLPRPAWDTSQEFMANSTNTGSRSPSTRSLDRNDRHYRRQRARRHRDYLHTKPARKRTASDSHREHSEPHRLASQTETVTGGRERRHCAPRPSTVALSVDQQVQGGLCFKSWTSPEAMPVAVREQEILLATLATRPIRDHLSFNQ